MAGDSPLVTVIVPVYNVQDYVGECLDSLRAQSLAEIEIICIDDGSTDRSGEICEAYAGEDHRICVIHQENAGQSAARNAGLKRARGTWILFVDSDDYIAKDACEKLWEAAVQHNLDIVHGDMLNEAERLDRDPAFRYIPQQNRVIRGADYLVESLKNLSYDVVPWINLLRKDFLDRNQIRFLEGCYYEDHEFSLRLYTAPDSRFMKIRFPYYFYRQNRVDSTTNAPDVRKAFDFIRVLSAMDEHLRGEALVHLSAAQREAAEALYTLALYHFSRVWARINTADKRKALQKWASEGGLRRRPVRGTLASRNMQLQVMVFVKVPWLFAAYWHSRRSLRVLLGRRRNDRAQPTSQAV